MPDNTNNTTEEVVVEETVETSVETVSPASTDSSVQETEKTLTQEQVNSIVKKLREEEAKKAEATNKELQERLEKIEKERETERLEAEIRAKALEEAEKINKQAHLDSIIESKVNDTYKESIKSLVIAKLGDLKSVENDVIEKSVVEIVSTFPAGVAKGTTNTTQVLNQTTTPPAGSAGSQKYKYVFKGSGTQVNITDEEYDKLPLFKKENIEKIEQN